MTSRLISAILLCAASCPLFAETKEAVYVGIDARGMRHESKESAGDPPWLRDVAFARKPTIMLPEQTRSYQGVGIFRLTIDPTTGHTKSVTIIRETGHHGFDRSSLVALKVWRFKPQTWSEVDIAIAFQQGGGVLFFPRYTTLPVRKK
jgi:TonB family protein